jgi:predicted nucleotidyltransferase
MSSWVNIVSSLDLPQKHIEYLSTLFEYNAMHSLCKSIILVGSWSRGNSLKTSDLDLLIITKDKDSKNKIAEHLHTLIGKRSRNRPEVDIKILSLEEFSYSWQSQQHFMLLTYCQSHKVLWGSDVFANRQINPPLIQQTMSREISTIDEAAVDLESGSRFQECGISLLTALKTFIFLDYYFSNKVSLKPIENILQNIFGDIYRKVHKIFYQVTNRIALNFKFSGNVRVHRSEDDKYSDTDYQHLLIACEDISKYAQKVYRKITGILSNNDFFR